MLTMSSVNLLELALPDAVMNSDTIGDCIGKQRAYLLSVSAGEPSPDATTGTQTTQTHRSAISGNGNTTNNNGSHADNDHNHHHKTNTDHRLLARILLQCLSLSNASQMFVFQLLAALLVLLAYLVNVDPRHVDLGYKSLSIGLAYFVANLLTVQSGGFYGNPMHLVSLTWFATTAHNWRDEWIIYLVVPFVAGLFGALSHEYIDFTSLRNRNRRLHLRRSFYSLDTLHSNPPQTPRADDTGSDGLGTQMRPPAAAASSAEQRSRRRSSSSAGSSGSLGAPSVLTLATQTHEANEPSSSQATVSPSRKLASSASYARQLYLEHQQQQQQQHQHRQMHHSQSMQQPGLGTVSMSNGRPGARTSDFDANFLISSLSAPLH